MVEYSHTCGDYHKTNSRIIWLNIVIRVVIIIRQCRSSRQVGDIVGLPSDKT